MRLIRGIIFPLFLCTIILLTTLMGWFLLNDQCHGIVPRRNEGLWGIITAPLFHADWNHFRLNIVPLFVLIYLLRITHRKSSWSILILGWLFTGALVWLFADLWPLQGNSLRCHIGISGVIYMLAAFIFVNGLVKFSARSIAIGFIVIFLYGSMAWGIFPQEIMPIADPEKNISWESHLFGAIVGVFLAFQFKGTSIEEKHTRKNLNLHTPTDDRLWQEYLENSRPEDFEEPQKTKNKKLDWDELL